MAGDERLPDEHPAPNSQGMTPEKLAELEAAAASAPLDPTLQITLAAAYETTGDRVKAAAARLAALALSERNALALYNIATAYMNQAQLAEAERWYRVTLALDPGLAVAHQNLASLLRERGDRAAADEHLRRAYTKQAVYIEQGAPSAPRVLLACAGGIGNVPVRHLMPEGRFTQIRCFVEYASDTDLYSLPEHDVVFNAIGDPDVISDDDARLRRMLAQTARPLLNAPQRVARTRRDKLPDLLAGIAGAIVPAARRIDIAERAEAESQAESQAESHANTRAESLADAIDRDGPRYPVILRPPASHGGEGVLLANDRSEVVASALSHADSIYATAFHDYCSADGYFRKYRMIFVDREPYPYHLAISRQWLVHYFSAEMLELPWKLDEERRFLEDPEAALGARVMETIREIARRVDLDYAGIDFGLTQDGMVLVFEANATMLVHPEPPMSGLAHKNVHVQAIVDAFARMIASRTARHT